MTPVLHPDRVESHGADWVAAGLISDDQLDAIRRFEHLEDPTSRRFSVGAEIAVYLGSLLALTGAGMVVAERWDALPFPVRLALAVGLAALGMVSGAWAYRQHEAATDRLGGFLTLVGLSGVAFAVGLAIDRVDPSADEAVVIGAGIAVAVVGGWAWRNRPRPLELAAVVVAVSAVVTASVSLADLQPWLGGATMVVLGAGLAIAAARGFVRPAAVATALGAALAYVGGFALGDLDEHLGPSVALAVALTLLVHGVRGDRPLPLAVGVVGGLIATEAVLATTFDGAFAAGIVSAVGLMSVLVVILRTRRTSAGPAGDG